MVPYIYIARLFTPRSIAAQKLTVVSGGSKILKRRVPLCALAKNSEPRPFLCVTTAIFFTKDEKLHVRVFYRA